MSLTIASPAGVLLATQHLEAAFSQLENVTRQLATLQRINSASDDPAGLIAATQLQDELTTLQHTAGADPNAEINITAALSDVRDADVVSLASDLVHARILGQTSILALKLQIKQQNLLGQLIDASA